MRCTAENALYLCRGAEQCSCVHIDVDKMHNKAIELLFLVIFFDQRAYARSALFGKVLVRIGKNHPVALCLIERKVLRRCKVIDPVEVKDLRSARTRDFRRCIRRARIDDNHLIGKAPHRCEPARQIFRLIFRYDTGRDLHRISSINSIDFRCAASAASACVRYSRVCSRSPMYSEASAAP